MGFGIKTRFKKKWPRLRAAIVFPIKHIKNLIKILPISGKKILFILNDELLFRDDDGSGRDAYLILNLFSDMGYQVYFYRSIKCPKDYYRLGKYGQFIYTIKNLKVIDKIPIQTSDIILAFDDEELSRNIMEKNWRGYVYVNCVKPPSWSIGSQVLPIPYFLHPRLHRSKQLLKINSLRGERRKIRAMFAGNTTPDYYDGKGPKLYGQLTRIQALKILTGHPAIKCFSSTNGFKDYISTNKKIIECLMLKTSAQFDVHPSQWLKLISTSDFFMCFSGTDVPMCHNSIEAMSVGTIPIISYPDWFFPSLEHGKNAIVYSGEEDLFQKLNDVMNLSEDDILIMRKNVIEYYDNNLSATAFLRKFEAVASNIFTITLHPRLIVEGSIYVREDKSAALFKLGLYLEGKDK